MKEVLLMYHYDSPEQIMLTNSHVELANLFSQYAKGEGWAEKSMAVSLMRIANALDWIAKKKPDTLERIAKAIESSSDDGK